MKKLTVHSLVLRYPGAITVKSICGRYPEDFDSFEHAGLNKWKGVTCKQCLRKKNK